MLAMSTHGRTGWDRTALGSVAMKVVHDSPCPVLVQQPARD
jgi:nucleotide-binding universal stress UspA family protein